MDGNPLLLGTFSEKMQFGGFSGLESFYFFENLLYILRA